MTTSTKTKTDARGRTQPLFTKTCPECCVVFKGTAVATFCCQAHKRAFHTRNQKRGQAMMPLLLAWRGGRGQKEVSKLAYAEMCRLADFWNAEDREAGRQSQAVYAAAKLKNGWTAVDYQFG